MSFRDIARAQLKVDEGEKFRPYRDSFGNWTVGVGRNLDAVPFSQAEVDFMLENDLAKAENDARVLFPNFDLLSDNRKAALANMAFNLGRERLRRFTKLIVAVAQENFDQAATEMLASSWSVQVGVRATRLAKLMRQG